MSDSITLSIIVAMAQNRVIGHDNTLLWHIPEDLKRFKTITSGKVCIMGRKTYESILDILGKPLPNRKTIVVTRNEAYETAEGVDVCNSFEQALDLGKKIAIENGQNEIICAGGAQIYAQALPEAARIYLTIIEKTYYGDSSFPQINKNDWQITREHISHALLSGTDKNTEEKVRIVYQDLDRVD